MNRAARTFASSLLGLALVLAAPRALAQKSVGDQLMDDHKYAEAVAVYQQAYDTSHDVALLYNIARADEALGDYPEALDALERFESEASPTLRARVPGLHDLMGEIAARIATLVVRTSVPGARLLVRDKAIGVIDHETRLRTRAGAATIEVDADGYEPFTKSVELQPGKTTELDAQLVAKRHDAILLVRTTPAASVTVDGLVIGPSPLDVRLAPGLHDLRASASGYEDDLVQLTLAEDEHRSVDLALKKQPSVLTRWWFWTAIGVVVAGGVATTIALTTERSPSTGTFSPGRIPAP